MATLQDKALIRRENQIRNLATKKQLILKKGYYYDDAQGFNYVQKNGYSVVDRITQEVVAGADEYKEFLLTLDEAETFINQYQR